MRSELAAAAFCAAFLALGIAQGADPEVKLAEPPPRPVGASPQIKTHDEAAAPVDEPEPPAWYYNRTDDARYAFDPPVREPGDYLHDGLFVRFGVGPMYLDGRFEGAVFDDAAVAYRAYTSDFEAVGLNAEAAIGGSPFDGFTLGIRLGFLFLPDPQLATPVGEEEIDLSPTVAPIIGALVDWYVLPDAGLHLFAGAAFSVLDIDDGASFSASELLGGVLSGGIGYEAWISPQWSFGAQLRIDAGYYSGEGVNLAGDSLDFVAPTAQLTFTYH